MNKKLYLEEFVVTGGQSSESIAQGIGTRCAGIGFEWEKTTRVIEDFQSEVQEFVAEFMSKDSDRREKMYEELGDVYFALAQVCRRLGFDAEKVARDGNQKFIHRFHLMQKLIEASGKTLPCADLGEYDYFWQQAKTLQRGQKNFKLSNAK